MKVGLIGYGKMGKAIEKALLLNNHQIRLKINSKNTRDLNKINLESLDLAIDFSIPEAAFNNIKFCLENGVRVLSGTTAWLNRYDEIVELVERKNGTFFYAPNYSIGVNLLFALNKKLFQMMCNHPAYQLAMEEVHHTEKLDSPSGTALKLKADIDEIHAITDKQSTADWNHSWKKIPITSKRIAETPGTHIIKYFCDVDSIEIKHIANSRDGFVKGVITAAEWMQDKQGVFTMDDLLEI